MPKKFTLTQGETDLPTPVRLLDYLKRPQNITGWHALTFSMWTVDFDGPRTDIFRHVPVTSTDDVNGLVNWPASWPADLTPGTYACQWTVTFANGKTKDYPRREKVYLTILGPQAG